MITLDQVREFLSHPRIAVVGVSADPKKFGNIVYRELVKHGYETVPVNLTTTTIDGVTSYPTVASIPGDVDGVVVVVGPDHSADVVRDCIGHVTRVWLFKGLGAAGADTDEAVALCRDNGIDVTAGACPMMFLEPVAAIHRVHRGMRKLNRSLVDSA